MSRGEERREANRIQTQETICFEVERYQRTMCMESKPGVYGKAYEIGMVTKFFEEMKRQPGRKEVETVFGLMSRPEDDFFLFFQNFYGKEQEELIREAVETWLKYRMAELKKANICV